MKKATIGVASALAACAIAAGLSQAGIRPSAPGVQSLPAAVRAEGHDRQTTYAADETTQVLIDAPAVSPDEIVRVVKHGDHWHVFTRDGREIITYSDPSRASSASQLANTASVLSADQLASVSSGDVVSILRHGNHWHIRLADGREFISYEDPSGLYPGVPIGEYEGSHGPLGHGHGQGGTDHGSGQHAHQATDDSGHHHHHGGLVQVLGMAELAKKPITRILRHGDHYHAYTADGTEYITRDDPSSAFPGIRIEEYGDAHDHEAGDHGHHGGMVGPIEQDPNDPKRVVRIEHHEDHWHLHHADGSESITRDDPSELYPGVPIEEYDESHGHHFDPLQEDERFGYDDITAELLVPLNDISYGNVIYCVGYDRAKGFVIPHLDHYHYVSVDTIIQFCKHGDESFGGHSARSVVATLKYLVEHPEARPEGKDGWGSSADIVKPDQGGQGESEEGRDVVRIVRDGRFWFVYYGDGSWSTAFNDPKDLYPNISIEEAVPGPDAGMDSEEVIEKYRRLYGMTRDDFEDALMELPAVPLSSVTFNADGTASVHGRTYQFKSLAQADPESEMEMDEESAVTEGAAGLESEPSEEERRTQSEDEAPLAEEGEPEGEEEPWAFEEDVFEEGEVPSEGPGA